MTRIEIEPERDRAAEFASVLKSVVVPRPIAWVSTLSAGGIGNLAPHSFFTVASERPPVVQFTSIGRKDSVANVEATGEFVINLASEPDFETVNSSATDYPAEIDEFEEVGVETEPAASVSPPRVATAPAAIECVLRQTIPVGEGTLVLGDVVWIAVDRDAMRDGRPDIEALRPLARLGGAQWSLIGEVRALRRIPYKG